MPSPALVTKTGRVEPGGDRGQASVAAARCRGATERGQHGGRPRARDGGGAARPAISASSPGSSMKNMVSPRIRVSVVHASAGRVRRGPSRPRSPPLGRRPCSARRRSTRRDRPCAVAQVRAGGLDPGRHGVAGHGDRVAARDAGQVQKDHRHGRGAAAPSAGDRRYPASGDRHDPALRRPEHVRAAARRPRQAARAGVRARLRRSRPTASCHPVDLDVARREHDAFVDAAGRPRPDGPRPRRRDRQPGPRLHVRSAAGHRSRRDPAPPGQAEPRRRAGGARGAGRRAAGSRRSAGSRRPGTVEGGDTFWLRPDLFCIGRTLRTNDDGRAPARRRSSAATCGSSTCRTGAGPAELIHLHVGHLAGRRRPRGRLPAAPAGRAVGAARRARRSGSSRCPDEEFPTLGCNVLAVRPGRRHRGRGQPGDGGARSRRPAARSTPTRRPRSGSTARAGRPA